MHLALLHTGSCSDTACQKTGAMYVCMYAYTQAHTHAQHMHTHEYHDSCFGSASYNSLIFLRSKQPLLLIFSILVISTYVYMYVCPWMNE